MAQIQSPYYEGKTIGHDLIVRNGRLHFHDLDLAALMTRPLPGRDDPLGSPLEVVYLPKITQQITQMKRWFSEISDRVGYPAPFEYAYASKANSAEEVTRTALAAGAHYETSSAADVDIVRYCLAHGLMPADRLCINNGFKVPGSDYSRKIIDLRADGFANITPVFEDADEIVPFIESGLPFRVGLRQKIDKYARDIDGISRSDIRFGMNQAAMHRAASLITDAPNLELVMYHAMQSDVATHVDGWLQGFAASLRVYAALVREHPTLHMYNWGGGFPARVGDLEAFDYPAFIERMLRIALEVCAEEDVPPPTLVGEFGRYTTAQHAFHLFKITKAKDNGSALPWYLIDGSIMSSFPDAWALGLEFLVLPLNNLEGPFQQVRLGGMTCDSDDIYPTRPEHDPLFMPVDTDGLYVGVFGIGCYQEMLGGVRGVKHCLLPEANELIIESSNGHLDYAVMPGQSYENILTLLNYQSE